MASSNVVASVRTHLVKHAKSSTVQTPAKWATDAGFQGSEASPLRAFMARSNGNGVGRTGRYARMTATELLEVLDNAEAYKATQDAKRQEVLARKIGAKVKRSAKAGGSQAKTQARTSRRKAKA